MANSEAGRTLFVFDFDNTLVNSNSDTWVGDALGSAALEKVKAGMSDWWDKWREFVNRLLAQLHSEGASREDILGHMKKLKIHEQAMKSLHAVKAAQDADAIIISDANSVFIECIVQECGVDDVFRAVLTNPATFSNDGLLSVTGYHTHSCQRCRHTPHMCKGTILKDYLQSCTEKYSRVVYVGDGLNDLCPMLQLNKGDVGVVRRGYGLEKALASGTYNVKVKATVHVIDFLQDLGDFITMHCL